jgi:hypothetical protein
VLASVAVVAAHPPAALTLPVFEAARDPSLPDVLAKARELLGQAVIPLRVIALDMTTDYEVTAMLVETEPIEEASPACGWRDLDDEACARLEPAGSRAAVASFMRERDEGWSPLRPQWSRPGWLVRASAWMAEQMAAAGTPVIDGPHHHQLWGLSVVLRATSDRGDVYLKCSADVFRHEAELTQVLARHLPDIVPDVLAVDAVPGWLLMADLGGDLLGDDDPSRWGGGLEALAEVQQAWPAQNGELADLGLPVRSIPDLAEDVAAWADDDEVMARLDPEFRDDWLATAPALGEACRRLHEIGPGPTIVHGDFHPWNVVRGNAGVRIFDWTDAAISHPFVDLATYLTRTKDVGARRLLRERYVEAWARLLPPQRLREATDLAVVVGSLYQVQSYRLILPTLLPGDLLDDADIDWMKQSITRHRYGLNEPT